MKRLIVLALCTATALPALAVPVDNLTKGVEFYKKGQYEKALAYLQDTVSKKPRVWQGHYYLANTYLTLGNRDEALQQYQLCRGCKPTKEIDTACEQMASKIAYSNMRHTSMPDYSNLPNSAHQQYVHAQRRRVMDDAAKDMQRLMDNTNNMINSQTNTAGGDMSLNPQAPLIEQQRAQVVRDHTAKEMGQVLYDAKTKIREMK